MSKFVDLTGKKFGRWTVIKRDENKNGTYWICECECGKKVSVFGGSLKRGASKSCGCLNDERIKQLRLTHGKTNTRLFHIWQGMKQRCYDTKHHKYMIYGGRGITICDEWQNFEPFYDWAMANGYKDDLTLDRIDTNGNYEPSNCRWATPKEQANNKRNNRLITYNGKTLTIAQWATELNKSYAKLYLRIYKYNWNIEKALTTP